MIFCGGGKNMKKNIVIASLVLSLILSNGAYAFADEKTEEKVVDETEIYKQIEILPPKSLSLEQVYEKMKTDSPQTIRANYNHDLELAVSKGYSESLSNLNKAKRLGALDDTSVIPSAELQVDFAKTQADKNYEAAMNKLKRDVYDKYFMYKYLESQVMGAKDNYDRALKLQKDAQLKFNVGRISKLETLNADTAVNDAQDSYEKAKTGFENNKMAFNMFVGYNINQEIYLTDKLEPYALPSITLNDALIKAVENRNEIAAARYGAKQARAALKKVNYYPHSSATYKKAKINYDLALDAAQNAPGNIEMDVRVKYSTMKQSLNAIELIKKNWDNAKEVARLGQLQFDAGVVTLNDVKGMNLAAYNQEQAYYKAVLDYNLSVIDFYQAFTAGTEAAQI